MLAVFPNALSVLVGEVAEGDLCTPAVRGGEGAITGGGIARAGLGTARG
jgi:hypothetical protein